MNENSRLPIVKLAAGGVAAASAAAVVYYLLKKRHREGPGLVDDPSLSPLERAQRLKEEGNRCFGQQRYDNAIHFFEDSVRILQSLDIGPDQQKLLANVFNNLSASKEFQKDLDSALEFAGKALNIDKNYAKVYVRRARLYRSLGQRANALADCGYAVRLLRGTNDKTLQRLNADLIEDLKAVAESRAEALYKERFAQEEFLPIAQNTVHEWVAKLALHDPLLNLMDTVSDQEPSNPLDRALFHFKHSNFELVLEPALQAARDLSQTVLERLLAWLLTARLYMFAALYRQMEGACKEFESLWDALDDQFKADNRGLLLAYWSVRVYADGVDTSEQRLRQNAELLQGNADPVVLLAHHCQRWGDNARAQTLITWARTLEPTRTDLEFYELVFAFYCAAAAQDVSELHSASAKLDRYITSHTLDSEFQVLTTAKVFAALANLELALDTMDKYKAAHEGSQESISLQVFHLLCYVERHSDDPEVMASFAPKLKALLERDPHNHEIMSLLSRFACERGNFAEAADLACKALLNARFIQEFHQRYSDLLLSFAMDGRPLPVEQLPPFRGPSYPKLLPDA